MRARMDSMFIAFANDSSMQKIEQRPDWGLHWPEDLVQDCFSIFYETNFQVLPFAGGWLDQPKSLRDDLRMCLWGVSYHRQRLKAPAPGTLPTFAERFGVKTNGNGKHDV